MAASSLSSSSTAASAPTDAPEDEAAWADAPEAEAACLGVPAYAEIRSDNAAFNRARASRPALTWPAGDPFQSYYEQITGACQGTTEQIMEWATRKWFGELNLPELGKAVAVKESYWRQSMVGDYEYGCIRDLPTVCGTENQSYGITQVKRSVWPGSWTRARDSTAYAADYWGAVVRMHYDGVSWLGDGTRGDIWNAVGAWYCGCGYSGGGEYATKVREYYDAKPWRRAGSRPKRF